MKIARNTPDQLILDDAPWWLGITLVVAILICVAVSFACLRSGALGNGVIFFLVGVPFLGAFFAIFVRRNQLILDRVSGKIIHRRSTVAGRREVVHYLENLDRAIVETMHGETSTHRMTLELSGGMDAGLHPFTKVYSSGPGARLAADAVNDWLGVRRSQ